MNGLTALIVANRFGLKDWLVTRSAAPKVSGPVTVVKAWAECTSIPVQPAPVVAPAGHWPVTGPFGLNDGSLRLSYQATDKIPFAVARYGNIWWPDGGCGDTGASHVAPFVIDRLIITSAPAAPFLCCQATYTPCASAVRDVSEKVRNDVTVRDAACR